VRLSLDRCAEIVRCRAQSEGIPDLDEVVRLAAEVMALRELLMMMVHRYQRGSRSDDYDALITHVELAIRDDQEADSTIWEQTNGG